MSRRIRIRSAVVQAVSASVAILLVIALQSPAGAHDNGTTAHLWNAHIKPMRDPGTINDVGNPVHWTKLKGVPASIADGVDNIGTAGFGLGLARPGTFYVNTSQIQRRVANGCGTGRAIKTINEDGSITCNDGPRGFSTTIADTGEICNVGCTEGTLTLSVGTWAITAKIQLDQTGSDVEIYVQCQLHAGGLVDESTFDVDLDGATETVTMPMQLIATLSSNVNASVSCRDFDVGSVYGSNLSIMAIRISD